MVIYDILNYHVVVGWCHPMIAHYALYWKIQGYFIGGNDMNNQVVAAGKVNPARKIVITAMMAALGAILMLLDFSIPFVIPYFVKFDFSEVPALIAAFALGPIPGVMVCLIKNAINLFVFGTTTGGVGEMSNFLLGASFILPAGYVYSKMKTRKGAIIGSLIGAVIMGLLSIPINYYITYPIYTNFMPIDDIMRLYQEIVPSVDGLLHALVVFNMPFTMFKGIGSAVVTFLCYKRLAPIIRGEN